MVILRCLVENSAQRGSALWGEHGVSFAIETPEGKVLFDTGQSGDVLVHNAAILNIPLEQFDALAISHAHYDHTGGLERFLAFARPGIPLYANSDLFQERFSVKEGKPESIGLRLEKDQLSKCTDFRLSSEPAEILPGIWTTGEITGRNEFEGRSPNHMIYENGNWLPDPYKDDLSLVLDTRDGLVVVCGCCHAGLLNTLAHIKKNFSKRISAVIGGTHLVSAKPESLEHAVDELKRHYTGETISLYPNHCTGERAYLTLANAFGSHVQPCSAGTVLKFV
jgi:7,8-dihydropterin-6-yl-methyl-4-(beta-D-ribofuranosyl)aminobenzene 5'-phosphate synthase